MKKKLVCGMFTLCLALSMAGCGKSSEERQAANYYQNELGLDKEDAEELAHEIYGEDEEETSVTEEVPEEIVVEPLPEFVNSEWYDGKVQIYDMVFSSDYCMTEEDIRKIVEGSAYDVELTETFDENGEVCLSGLMVNGNLEAQFWKSNRSLTDLGKYGWFNDGDYYAITYGFRDSTCWYNKASVEFKNFQTRDDVLAYLAENGFDEVEEEQATYAEIFENARNMIYPDETPVEYADVPHYYCKGAQSITFFRVHKLGETDQEIEYIKGFYETHHYSGAHLNSVNYATFEFDTDGTIVSREYSEINLEFMVMGEQID